MKGPVDVVLKHGVGKHLFLIFVLEVSGMEESMQESIYFISLGYTAE